MNRSNTERECAKVERELAEVLDRGSPVDVADFASSRLSWALEKVRALSEALEAARAS